MKMIITPNKFALLIEETVKNKKMSYIDAILWYCERMELTQVILEN